MVFGFAQTSSAQEIIALEEIGGLHSAYVVPRDDLNRVDVQLIVLSGTFDEVAPAGAAHLLEHLAAFSADARILRRPRARDLNANISGVATIYTNSGTPKELERLMKLSRAVLDRPELDARFMQGEIEIVERETLLRERQNPTRWLFRKALQNLYGATIGRASDPVADLPDLTLDAAFAFFETHYVPSNVMLIVSGKVDVAEAKALVSQYFGDTRGGTPPAKPWLDDKPKPQHRVIEKLSSARIWDDMLIYTRFVDFAEVETSIDMQGVFFIATSIYQARMNKALLYDSEEALSYSSSTYLFKNGDLEYRARLMPLPGVSLDQLLERIEEALDDLARLPVTDEEISQARQSNALWAANSARNPRDFLAFLANVASDGFPPITPTSLEAMVRNTSDDEVRAFLRAFAGPAAVSAIKAYKGAEQ